MIYRNFNRGPIDRFCSKHPRFGIPGLMKFIAIARVAVFLLDLLFGLILGGGRGVLVGFMYFIPAAILQGQVWRVVTWIIAPSELNPFFLLIGCFFYYQIGTLLEREWGTAKFNLFYFTGAVLSVVLGFVLSMIQFHGIVMLDLAYYLNLTIFLVVATYYGQMQVMLYGILPIKMKWMAIIYLVGIVVGMVDQFLAGAWSVALVPLIGLINYLIFTWEVWSVRLGVVRRKADPQVVHFKKVQKEARKKANETGGYRHKCAVCGITDADDPNMEFRYCSRCDGYHCYCANHINNHVHIHE